MRAEDIARLQGALFQPAEAGGTRSGPRPFGLQLLWVLSLYAAASGSFAAAREGLLPWHPDISARADALAGLLRGTDPCRFHAALSERIGIRLKEFLDGVLAYRSHPYRRNLEGPPAAFAEGSSQVFDYGGSGPSVLFVPSLINPSWVLDLKEDRSLMRWLAANGVRPFLVDWGTPAAAEAGYGIADYVGRLVRIISGLAEKTGGPIALAGYCMGGTLSVAAAQIARDRVERLALLAAPWDFKADAAPAARAFDGFLASNPANFDDGAGSVSMEAMQLFFTSLDPTLTERKFRRFARLDPACGQAEDFVAVEDWNNDGPPMACRAARDCMRHWYIENRTAAGEWQIAGVTIRPGTLALPVLAAIPRRDRIVPAASALALANAIPGAAILRPPSGHVGMIVSAGAREGLWAGLRDWLMAGKAA